MIERRLKASVKMNNFGMNVTNVSGDEKVVNGVLGFVEQPFPN